MKRMKVFGALAATMAMGLMVPATALADEVLCKDSAINHMIIDTDYVVDPCVAAGVGNIGNGQNDDFLATAEGEGYTHIAGGSFDTTNSTNLTSEGTFSLNAALWQTYSSIAIGFKFGTGNQPDEWFIYTLVSGVTTGTWKFIETSVSGGNGLSHVQLYAGPPVTVPEPASLALLLFGLVGVGASRKVLAV